MAGKPLAAGSKGIIRPQSRSGSIDLTARKRLSRKSPGPELRKSLRLIPPPSNVVGPETVSVFENNNKYFIYLMLNEF